MHISFSCFSFKILKRPIYLLVQTDLSSLIYPTYIPIYRLLLPRKQAGSRRGRSTVDQITFLTQDIEDSLLAIIKRYVCQSYSSLRYLWHLGLACKLLRFFPDQHTVSLVMEFVRKRCLPSPPVPKSKAGYHASRMVSHKDQSWFPSFLI